MLDRLAPLARPGVVDGPDRRRQRRSPSSRSAVRSRARGDARAIGAAPRRDRARSAHEGPGRPTGRCSSSSTPSVGERARRPGPTRRRSASRSATRARPRRASSTRAIPTRSSVPPSSSPRCSPRRRDDPDAPVRRAPAARPRRVGVARRDQPHRARPRPVRHHRRALPRTGRPHTRRAGAVVRGRRRSPIASCTTGCSSLAGRLSGAGVGRGDRVGIATERSIEMVVGVLATLEVGASYVPARSDVSDRTARASWSTTRGSWRCSPSADAAARAVSARGHA